MPKPPAKTRTQINVEFPTEPDKDLFTAIHAAAESEQRSLAWILRKCAHDRLTLQRAGWRFGDPDRAAVLARVAALSHSEFDELVIWLDARKKKGKGT